MANKIPMRMCVACREMKPKKELVRIVRAATEDKTEKPKILIDRSGKMNGRGAYLCASGACLEKAQRIRALERALDCPISAEVYEALKEQLGEE